MTKLLIASEWKDYEIIDAGDGEKLERWGNYILRRPDPQAIWEKDSIDLWGKADLIYHRSDEGGGYWEKTKELESWSISYGDLKFNIKPTGFKHTGLFPEQSVNWEWIREIASKRKSFTVLNLFAYTGGATIASLKYGAEEVVHVDASKGMIEIAKKNVELSGLNDKKVRFIQDDVIKFIEREIRRGRKYDLIILDPPTYGRGSRGEMWKIKEDLKDLLLLLTNLLTQDSVGLLLNTYATDISIIAFENLVKTILERKFKGSTISYELGIPISILRDGIRLILPTGMSVRYCTNNENLI